MTRTVVMLRLPVAGYVLRPEIWITVSPPKEPRVFTVGPGDISAYGRGRQQRDAQQRYQRQGRGEQRRGAAWHALTLRDLTGDRAPG